MTNDEITARLLVLESIAGVALVGVAGIVQATSGLEQAVRLLDETRADARAVLKNQSPAVRRLGEEMLDRFLSIASQSLPSPPKP